MPELESTVFFTAPVIGFFGAALLSTSGVGGAALVTPLLVLTGVPVPVAIATDAAWCAGIKVLSLGVHRKALARGVGDIRWLLVAAVIGTLIGVFFFRQLISIEGGEAVLKRALGFALMLVGSMLAFRAIRGPKEAHGVARVPRWAQLSIAVVLGTVVGLTSIGAGSTFLPLLLFSVAAPFATIVALDLTLGLVLALVLGSAHLAAGLVDLGLLGGLALGGVPGVAIGALLHRHVQPKALASITATVVALIGFKLLV